MEQKTRDFQICATPLVLNYSSSIENIQLEYSSPQLAIVEWIFSNSVFLASCSKMELQELNRSSGTERVNSLSPIKGTITKSFLIVQRGRHCDQLS